MLVVKTQRGSYVTIGGGLEFCVLADDEDVTKGTTKRQREEGKCKVVKVYEVLIMGVSPNAHGGFGLGLYTTKAIAEAELKALIAAITSGAPSYNMRSRSAAKLRHGKTDRQSGKKTYTRQ